MINDFSADIELALETLRKGGVILYPTDTVWGLGCDATNEAAVDAVFRLKQRPAEKSCILLLADERDLLQYVTALDLEVFNFLDQVQKPTTVVYENVVGIAPNAMAEDGSAAIRVVKEDFCRHLIKRFRKPIVSTSANISGAPTPRFFTEIDPRIITGADYVVQYRQNDQTPAAPSAIVRWFANGQHEVIRS
ncbi:MAG: L-threonylcarbamoyladenylate synthase [Chitinophagaceae bacterium]